MNLFCTDGQEEDAEKRRLRAPQRMEREALAKPNIQEEQQTRYRLRPQQRPAEEG